MKNIKYLYRALLLIIFLYFIIHDGISQENEPKQAINVCAIAIPVMNFYVLNYEYLYQSRHGLAARFEYAPKMKGAETTGVALAGVLNYRWHFTPNLKGFFVGPYARYRYVYGNGETEHGDYKFNVPEINVGLNAGYRWVSKIGVNVVVSAGYGYSWKEENLSPDNQQVKSKLNEFKSANDANKAILDAPFYGELSIGYAF